jgi:glutamate-ammonia-ligase adenylyltransferase
MLETSLRQMLTNIRLAEHRLDTLRRFRRRGEGGGTLRIGVRDLLKLQDVRETTEALTDLACVLIQALTRLSTPG